MDRVIELVRRPLLVLDEPGFVAESISIREPHKKSRIENRLRRLRDAVNFTDKDRRLHKTEYNRRQRDLYHSRVPRAQRMLRPGQQASPKKRTAPEKRLGIGRRTR